MLNYKDTETYKKQFEIWKSLSAQIWKADAVRQSKIPHHAFVRAFNDAGIELKAKNGTPLSVGRINGHLKQLKLHIAELGKLNGVSKEKIENWKSNVRLCLLKEDVAEIKDLVTDDDFFSSL